MAVKKDADGRVAGTADAYATALRLLARREYSRSELRRKLDLGGYAKVESDAALARLGEQHYQDDQRFAAMLVRHRAAQGYGPARIRMELKTHGLADAAIRRLLDEAEVDWQANAAHQLRRRYGGKPAADREEQGKRAQFLLRRGFSAATVRYAIHADVDEADEES